MTSLPTSINATKSITYDVASIVDAMMTMDYREKEEDITIEDVIEWIGDDIHADFSFAKIFYLDENGGEL